MAEPVLGPYRIVRELGRGAVGVVYEAIDQRLDRRVALKVVPASGASKEKLDRFEREAQVQARLSHPNVVPVFEAGVDQGKLYLAMELVKGESLRQELVRRGRLPAREALETVALIARGVHAAHEAGVVHRDLKPENVLRGEDGVPRVADFGAAKDLAVDARALSKTGAILGTPLYMAPEQLGPEGSVGATEAVDVWALGAILHELVTGEPPFLGDNLIALAARITTGEPRSHSTRDPVARAALAIARRGLAKAPRERFESALAFARACDEARKAAPGRATPTGVLAALVLAAVGLGSTLLAWPAPPRPDPTEHPALAGKDLLARARDAHARSDAPALARLALALPLDEDAGTLEVALREPARPGSALALLLDEKTEEARLVAPPESPLGRFVRRLGGEPARAELARAATVSHGPAPTSQVAVAGETILATGARGGPLEAIGLDGSLQGVVEGAWPGASRSLVARGSAAAWATGRGYAVARAGSVREHDVAGRLAPLILTAEGHVVGWSRARKNVLTLERDTGRFLRSFESGIEPYALASSEDGEWLAVAGEFPGQGAVVGLVPRTIESPTRLRSFAIAFKEGPVAWVADSFAVVETSCNAVLLLNPRDPFTKSRRIPLEEDRGVTRAIAPGPAGFFAIGRQQKVHVYATNEGLDRRVTVDAGDIVTSLAWSAAGDELVIGRESAPALVVELALGPRDIPELVQALYRGELGREADPGGLATHVGWGTRLRREGKEWSEILEGLRASLRASEEGVAARARGVKPARLDDRILATKPVESTDSVSAAVFLDRAGERVATGGVDGVVRAWNPSGSACLWEHVHEGPLPVHALAIVERPQDGARWVAVMDGASDGGSLLSAVDDELGGPTRHEPLARTSPGWHFDRWAVSPLGERAFAASTVEDAGRVAWLLFPPRGERQDFISTDAPGAKAGPALAVAFSPDGREVATALVAGGVRVVDATGAEVSRAESPPLRTLVYTPDGAAPLGITTTGTLGAVEGKTFRPLVEGVRSVAFAPDGFAVAVLLATGELSVRAYPSWDELASLRGVAAGDPAAPSPPLAWSEDGRRLLAGAGPVSVIEVRRGELTRAVRARLEATLARARVLAPESKRAAWALARAVAAAPWDDAPAVVAAREWLGALEREARIEAWEAAAEQLPESSNDRRRAIQQARDLKTRAR